MLQFNTGKKLEKVFPPDQFDALIDSFENYNGMAVTKADVRESELRLQLEIEKVRAEAEKTKAELKTDIEKVRGEVKETEARLKVEIEKVRTETEKIRGEIHQSKLDTLKWMVGCFIALAAIMAKGFGWIGF